MALLTAAEARAYLPALTGTGEDALLDTLIGRVGGLIAETLGYPLVSGSRTIESRAYTLYSGPGGLIEVVDDGRRLVLPCHPISAISAIYDDPNEEYGASTLVDSADYMVCGERSDQIRLKALSTHGAFSDSPFAVKVACTAGLSTIPEEIKHAAGLAVAHNYNRRATGGGTEIDAAGVRVFFERVVLPSEILPILAPYRSAYGWAA